MLESKANNEEELFLLKGGYNQMNYIFKTSSSHFRMQCKNWLELPSSMTSASNSDVWLLLSLSSYLVKEKDSDRVVLLSSPRAL